MDGETTREDRPRGVNSLLGVSEVECDKCRGMIRHLDRYCYNTLECPVCGAKLETIAERESHFSQQHPQEPSRGTRYCLACCTKAGFIKE